MERKWWTLIAVSVAIFMLLLDITVVNVALPDIQRSLHSSFSDLQWVVDAYSLTLAAFLLTAGALADLLRAQARVRHRPGRLHRCPRPPAAWPTTPLMLNLARAVQGTGGAMMFATSLALIASAFHGRERGTAFGVFGAVIGARRGGRARCVGGVITSGIGWEWIFFVNVPIGIAAVVADAHAGGRVARPQRARRRLGSASSRSPARCSCSCSRSSRATTRAGARREIVSFLIGSAVLIVAVRRRRAPPAAPDARPDAVPPARVHRREHRRLRALGLDLRDVPVPDALHPGRARLQPAAGRPALPADHAAVVLRRADRRGA